MNSIHALMKTIHDRRDSPSSKSYTTQLMAQGLAKIIAKVREESEEFVQAAELIRTDESDQHVIHESADLVYHMLVLLSFRGLDWSQVETELCRRSGVSGLDEKASRSEPFSSEPRIGLMKTEEEN